MKTATPSTQFTTADRIRILQEYDSYPRGDERRGFLLRRYGVYTSQIATWRARLARGDHSLDSLSPGHKRSPVNPLAAEVTRLTQEHARFQAQLAKAEAIIDMQKKWLRSWGRAFRCRATEPPDAASHRLGRCRCGNRGLCRVGRATQHLLSLMSAHATHGGAGSAAPGRIAARLVS